MLQWVWYPPQVEQENDVQMIEHVSAIERVQSEFEKALATSDLARLG